jgi:hypothetical protein
VALLLSKRITSSTELGWEEARPNNLLHADGALVPRSRSARRPAGERVAVGQAGHRCQARDRYGWAFEKRTIRVPRQTWARLVACIDSSGFWAMPEMHHDSLMTTDGSDVHVEAASEGRYHVIWRRNLNERGTYGQDPAAAPLKPCLALINQLVGKD